MTAAALIVLVLLLVVGLGVVLISLKRVPSGNVAVLERLGAFQRVLPPGLHLVLLGDRVRRVDLGEQSLHLAAEPLVSEDNMVMLADVDVRYRVVDPRAATYEVADLPMAIDQPR